MVRDEIGHTKVNNARKSKFGKPVNSSCSDCLDHAIDMKVVYIFSSNCDLIESVLAIKNATNIICCFDYP